MIEVPIWLLFLLLGLIVATGLGAGLCVGLYMGERGRRLDLAKLTGQVVPLMETPGQIHRPLEPEERVARGEEPFDQDTIERGAEDIRAMAVAQGFEVSMDEAREHARRMLAEAHGLG